MKFLHSVLYLFIYIYYQGTHTHYWENNIFSFFMYKKVLFEKPQLLDIICD